MAVDTVSRNRDVKDIKTKQQQQKKLQSKLTKMTGGTVRFYFAILVNIIPTGFE